MLVFTMQRLSSWASEHRAELLCTLGPPIVVLLVRAFFGGSVLYGLLELIACPGIVIAAWVAWWVSCRVADREGQPWAWLSFWLVAGSYVGSAWLLFVLGPPLVK